MSKREGDLIKGSERQPGKRIIINERRSQVRPSGRALVAVVREAGDVIPITSDIQLDDRDVEERFVRASGPGGQNVNKVSTAVELRFNVRDSSLPGSVKERLIALAGNRITADGMLLIDSREHRTQLQNRDAARARLVALVRSAAVRPKKRRPTKPKAAAREKRLASKKRRSAVKSLRSRTDED